MKAIPLLLAMMGAAPAEDDPTRQPTAPPVVASGPDPVYPGSFYQPFQPQTALDMLERTPGFLLTEGSSVRGFGGAAGNVLIDGQRPTVKGGGLTEVLRRIAASRVARITLLRGSEAAQAPGQTLVANVILRVDGKGSGNASLTLAHTAEGRVSPSGRISLARAIAGWQSSIELSSNLVRYPSTSLYDNHDANGALTSHRLEKVSASAPSVNLALSTAGMVAGGTLTVNLRLNDSRYRSLRAVAITAPPWDGSTDATRTILYGEVERSGELGADWTRPLGKGWTAKLVGLGRIEHNTTDEDYREGTYRGLSLLDQKPTELVGRVTVTREGEHKIRPELGFELAENRLTSHLDYAEDHGIGLVPVALSNVDTRVSELRGEAFANLTLRLGKRLNLEAGTALELSRIRVFGLMPSEQSLSYLKPSAALVWSPSGETQLRLGMRRKVDQLDFGDFAASVNQADGRSLGGNSQLRPARITRVLARIDHRWGQGGALAVEAYHQWHQGLLGYLVLPGGDQALGTIGDARQWGITTQGTLPLSALLKGARLTVDGTWRGSRLIDPLTGTPRAMDDISPLSLTAELRHDLPKLKSSWGLTFTAAEQSDTFYTNEVLHWHDGATWGAYLETTALPFVKTTVSGKALLGSRSDRLRSFYEPTRAGAGSGDEMRHQRQGGIISIIMAKSF
ncbi:TonB-dependent receptor plug domain-containing protein [Novosphingobium terrae]|uniref:TonB-dependent receptor plug domain-containing protein n=1 Tax=Novosphingobium terrae TaxID=2726189 RepID=UPI00197DC016|nr:TonB-dependent receptor [Novosphingobium terrae]